MIWADASGEAAGRAVGIRLDDGRVIARRVLAVATRMQARTAGLDGLDLPMQDLPDGMGRGVKSGLGALAGAHINSVLAVADADVAVASGLRACS